MSLCPLCKSRNECIFHWFWNGLLAYVSRNIFWLLLNKLLRIKQCKIEIRILKWCSCLHGTNESSFTNTIWNDGGHVGIISLPINVYLLIQAFLKKKKILGIKTHLTIYYSTQIAFNGLKLHVQGYFKVSFWALLYVVAWHHWWLGLGRKHSVW